MKAFDKFMYEVATFLRPYCPVIGPLASAFTMGHFLIQILISLDMISKRHTRNYSSWPFVGGLTIGIIMVKYSIMLEDFSMFVVNFTGVLVSLFNIFIFNKYSKRRNQDLYKPLRNGIKLALFTILYSYWEKTEVIGCRYAVIATIIMLTINAAPLLEIKNIVSYEDTSSIYFFLMLNSSISNFLWCLYGFLIKSNYVMLHHLLAFSTSLIQVILCLTYSERYSCKSAATT